MGPGGHDHSRSDVFGLGRNKVLHRFRKLEAGRQFCMHDARKDRADMDVVRAQFLPQCVRQTHYTELGGTVGRNARKAADAAHRRNIDNASAAALYEPFRRQFATQNHTTQVDVDHLVLGGPGFGEELAGEHHTRVVHQDVEWPENTLRVVEERGERLRRGDIERQCDNVTGDFGGDLLGQIGVEIADRYLGSGGGESLCGGQPDSTRRR